MTYIVLNFPIIFICGWATYEKCSLLEKKIFLEDWQADILAVPTTVTHTVQALVYTLPHNVQTEQALLYTLPHNVHTFYQLYCTHYHTMCTLFTNFSVHTTTQCAHM